MQTSGFKSYLNFRRLTGDLNLKRCEPFITEMDDSTDR